MLLLAPLLLLLLAPLAQAHNINLGAHSRECFHEQLHEGDKMTVTFQVGDREQGGSGSIEIDFWVRVTLASYYPIGNRAACCCLLLLGSAVNVGQCELVVPVQVTRADCISTFETRL